MTPIVKRPRRLPYGAWGMDVQIAARYRGCLHGRLPVDCTHFKGDVLVAVGGYSHAGSVHVFEPLEGLKAFHCCSHSTPVHTVAFSQPSNHLQTLLLFSSSSDVALLWDVQGCRKASDKGMPCEARTLATGLGYTQCASFSPDSQFVALGHGFEVLVYHLKTCVLDTTLTGHNGDITAMSFYPRKPQHVVTTAEDRTFKIWNLRESALLYQSAIISASPFTCLAIQSNTEALVLGSSDGKLRVFVLEGQHCHSVQESDIGRSLTKKQSGAGQHHLGLDKGSHHEPSIISSQPKWKGSSLFSTDSAVEMAPSQLLAISFWDHNLETSETLCDAPPLLDRHSKHPVRHVLNNTSHLVVVTHHSMLLLNSQTLELLDWKDLRDPLPVGSSVGETSLQPVPVMYSACFCATPVAMGDDLYCASSALMEATVSVLRLSQKSRLPSQRVCSAAHAEGEELQDTPTSSGIQLSVLSSTPLLDSSPLVTKMAAPSNAVKLKSQSSSSVSQGQFRKTLGVVDRPVTFHSKVKSSGYSSVPHGKLFTPLTSLSQRKAASASGIGTTRSKGPLRSVLQYPSDAQPATSQELCLSLTDRPSVVNSLHYSCEGRHLACACSDGSVHVMNASLNTDRGTVFVGHHGNVYSASWSHGNPWLISCSSDHTARLWCLSQKDPLLTISHSQTNSKFQQKVGAMSGKAKQGSKDNPPFSHEVTHAQFYYLDKFLLLACGNSFNLYKYRIDTERPDDVKRYQSSTKCQLVQQFPMQSAQHITAMSAINDFYSYIVLVTGSNKNIEVFDMNAGKRAGTLSEVHDRPVHTIVQNKGSKFIGHPPGAYDLFLTSAVSCGVKLWDLRTARCVQHYTSHPNRGVPLGATFSPCAKFITTGAENRSVYIYDIRSTAPLHKLACHSNTVTTVTYHPLYNQMVTGSADGKLWLFRNKS